MRFSSPDTYHQSPSGSIVALSLSYNPIPPGLPKTRLSPLQPKPVGSCRCSKWRCRLNVPYRLPLAAAGWALGLGSRCVPTYVSSNERNTFMRTRAPVCVCIHFQPFNRPKKSVPKQTCCLIDGNRSGASCFVGPHLPGCCRWWCWLVPGGGGWTLSNDDDDDDVRLTDWWRLAHMLHDDDIGGVAFPPAHISNLTIFSHRHSLVRLG